MEQTKRLVMTFKTDGDRKVSLVVDDGTFSNVCICIGSKDTSLAR